MKPRRKNPSRRPNVPSDATGEDIRALAEGGYDEGDYGDDVVMVFYHGDDTRMVRIVRGKWVVDTQRHATSSDRNPPTTHRPFPTRDRAFHYARRTGITYEAVYGTGARRNPDWHAIGVSAKDKAKRAHEWSKPHAAKAWEATKSGAKRAGAATKRGAKKAAPHVARGIRSVSERLDRWAVANPERPAPMGLSPAEIRRHVAGEASTAKGHHALALTHYRESAKFNVRGDYAKADYHGQMAHAHESIARSLEGVTRAIAKRRR